MSACVDKDLLNMFFEEVYGTKKKVDVKKLVIKRYKKEFKLLEKLCRVGLV